MLVRIPTGVETPWLFLTGQKSSSTELRNPDHNIYESLRDFDSGMIVKGSDYFI